MKHELSRKDFFKLSGAALATASLASCDALSTNPSGQGAGTASGPKGKEAPQLAALVKKGKLPPVVERLPDEPVEISPIDSVGTYGGEWRTYIPEVEGYDAYGKVGYDNLVRWDPEWTKVIPNIAKSWSIADDGRKFTFQLRKGMKWSDGELFTAEDIAFAYHDVLRNPKLYPELPTWLTTNGEPASIKAVDDLTVEVVFAQPNGFFLDMLATPDGSVLTCLPKHYLSRFHAKYNEDADRLAKREGFADWAEFFFSKGGDGLLEIGAWQNTELPTLLAWRVTVPMTGSRLALERNPYYWKTDSEGSQLPYLDRVVADVGLEPQSAVLKISNGEYSIPDSAAVLVADKPVYARSRERGKFHFITINNADMNTATIFFNLTHKDRALRRIFQDKNFRIGMSYAMDRNELISAVFQRQGQPYQAAPRPESDFFDEELAKQYTEHDTKLANQHLDRAGLDRRDGDDMRLRPDGERLRFTLKFMLGWHDYFPDVAERLQGYWRAVGVDVVIKSEEQTKLSEELPTNAHDAVLWGGDNGMRDAIINPELFFPASVGSYFALRWGQWYETRGRTGERPPAAARKQMELYDEVIATIEMEKRNRLFKELLTISREEFYVLGTALPEGNYNIVQNNFRNVPHSFPDASVYPDPGPTMPEQYYVEA